MGYREVKIGYWPFDIRVYTMCKLYHNRYDNCLHHIMVKKYVVNGIFIIRNNVHSIHMEKA